jgi:hypothetical protein
MGLEGASYADILAFYYPGTTLSAKGSGVRWTRIEGKKVTLFSTQPVQEAKFLPVIEDLLRRGESRLHSSIRSGVRVYLYPDVETFRNVMGEPGWIEAVSSGDRIDVQPASLLESLGTFHATLYHELLHVLAEEEAAPSVPIWFREGLVSWLTSPRSSGSQARPLDFAPIARSDESVTRDSYAAAVSEIRELANRYGEGALLGWLKSGLPAEVSRSIASNPATKSR